MPKLQAGFTLVELLMAALMLLVVAVTSFGAFTNSNRVLQQNEQLAGVSNVERVAQSYLRDLDFGVLKAATESTLTTAIGSQLNASDWAQLGATGSVQVTRMTLASRLVTVDLRVGYGTGRMATTSIRVAQRGVNP